MRSPAILCASLAALLAACSADPPRAPEPPPLAAAPARCIPAPARRALDSFVRQNRARYTSSIARAKGFLDDLDVDPIKLRAVHMKGKKKLVEALDAYARLYAVAPPDARPAIRARVEALARPTNDDRYHDMLTIGDREFKEDATSYLRAAFLLDRMGLDVRRYRAEIAAMKWRLDKHMSERGTHQQRAFHTYYAHFELSEPFPLDGALSEGLIAKKPEPMSLSRVDVYAITHEVYSAFDFGDRLDADPFGDAARLYLRGALPELATTWRAKRDPDVVSELVTCLRYTRFTGDAAYTEALGYLLDVQNADGSWGAYEGARARMGDLVRQGFYLHTTMVAIEALTLAFDDASRRGEAPECP